MSDILPQSYHTANELTPAAVRSGSPADPREARSADPEPIHVAYSHEGGPLVVPFAPAAFMYAGLGIVGVFAILLIVRLLNVPIAFVAIVGAAAGCAIGLWFLRRVWIRTVSGWRPARDGTVSDPSFRLRIVGEGSQTQGLVSDLSDQPFEPFVAFSWFAASFVVPGVGPDGRNLDGTPRPKNASPTVSELTGPQRVLIGILTVGFVAAIFVAQWMIMHSRQPFGPVQVFAGLGLSSFVVAMLTPTYVRIAPGSLDILRFGWRPAGLPAFEHWDLRASRILIDHRAGVIRVWGEGDGSRRAVLLRAAQIACRKRSLIRAILTAARSRYPTPPLPTDALVG